MTTKGPGKGKGVYYQLRGKGRGAPSAIRTGHFIRDYLTQHGEAYIGEIHSAYKEEIKAAGIAKKRRLRTPTYESFYKYFRLLRVLGLVEFVRDEEIPIPPAPTSADKLLSIRDGALPSVVPSVRRYFSLVPGRETDPGWDDPFAAWRPTT